MRLFRSPGRKTLTSPRMVQVTTLVTACYRALSLTDSERVCAGFHIGHLRVPKDSQVTIAKGGAIEKSEAFAPTYPQFVMRNSDLRSSWFCDVWDSNSLDVLSLKCEHALVKKQNLQLFRATYNFCWKIMCLSGKESILMKFSNNHKWDFGC